MNQGEGDVDMADDDDDSGPFPKNVQAKNTLMRKLVGELHPKMKYLLDCSFNICLYGVGSKVDFLNYYVQRELLAKENVCVFNGFT